MALILSQRLKALAFTLFKPLLHFVAFAAPKGTFRLLALTLKRVFVSLFTQFIQHFFSFFLFPYVFYYCRFIQSHCTYIVFFRPKVSIPFKYPMNEDTLYFGGNANSLSSYAPKLYLPLCIYIVL